MGKKLVIVTGAVVIVGLMGGMGLIVTKRDNLTDLTNLTDYPLVRGLQINVIALLTDKSKEQIVEEEWIAKKIKDKLASVDFFPPELQREGLEKSRLFQLFSDSDKQQRWGYSLIGNVVGWDRDRYVLTVQNIRGQRVNFFVGPDSHQPIYEGKFVDSVTRFTGAVRPLAYQFCPQLDLVEVVWEDGRELEELIDTDGELGIQNLELTRPEVIYFIGGRRECDF